MPDVPRSKIFDDIYFSVEDARAETKHVFLEGNDLPERYKEKQHFTICETGFGTGLNFLMAWEALQRESQHTHLHFISYELYPLQKEEIKNALQPYFDEAFLSIFLDKYPSKPQGIQEIKISDRVNLTLIFEDVNEAILRQTDKVDAWFLDGFAPAKNPQMWTDLLFSNMARLSHETSSFSTFTSAGFVRRGLQAVGFKVEKVRGFGRKREMSKGTFCGG